MSLKIEAKMMSRGELTYVGEKRTAKRKVRFEIANGNYPQVVDFVLVGENCDKADRLFVGQSYMVTFAINGRTWTNADGEEVNFIELNAWKFQTVQLSEV